MILPIYIYGHPVLRKRNKEVTKDYEGLSQLINDMYDTMYHAQGVGLAAPQIGKSLRLFVIDTTPYSNDDIQFSDFKETFINPIIHDFLGDEKHMPEGCLSIPDLTESILRKSKVCISYYDQHWNYHKNIEFDEWVARIIQHEYDHLDGILFSDRVNSLRRRLLKSKLNAISKGKFERKYKCVLS